MNTTVCHRCGDRCLSTPKREPAARPFRRAARGLCAPCAVHAFFQGDENHGIGFALPPNFDPEGLRLPHIQEQFARVLAIGGSELTMTDVTWSEVIRKWNVSDLSEGGLSMKRPLKAPFPYWGGKSRVAGLVWDRFGDVPNYVEPFAGSLAVLLGRPSTPKVETVNDACCFIGNFWRALQKDPDGVAEWADYPVIECDLSARHLYLVSQPEWRERMATDPEYYDVKIAGWWLWGIGQWIGSGWCSVQLPHLGDPGKGLHRQLPHLGNPGTGIHRKRPHLGNPGTGDEECVSDRTSGTRENLVAYMRDLATRLRKVRVCCGDWSRILGPSPTIKLGITGVFLDPPYSAEAGRQDGLYATDSTDVAHAVREWAVANGNNRDLRIALCGYDTEHAMPDTWECVHWKAAGGYGSQGTGSGRENSAREVIHFSPHCLRPQESLFLQEAPYDEPGPHHSDEWMRLLGWQDSVKDECARALEDEKGKGA